MATPDRTSSDDSSARFALLEMDAPKASSSEATPRPAPAPTPAPAPAPTALEQGRVLITSATSRATLDGAVRTIVAQYPDMNHPVRAALRPVYRDRLAAIVQLWWTAFLATWHKIALEAQGPLNVALDPSARQPIPTIPASTGTLFGALGAVVSESSTNAAVQTSGSLAEGTMRGVGFSTAAGYVQALANGVKRATADLYLSTLRGSYSYSDAQINALTVTIIAESTLPVGAGIVHQPTGPDMFTQRRLVAEAAAQELRETADATTLALAQRLVTDESSVTAWWAIGWRGNGSITRAELLSACGDAPMPKVPSTQLGRVMDSLRGQNYDCARIESKLPAGVKVRWQVGRGKDHVAAVGGEYGRVLAIIDLQDTGALAFDGDQLICAEVTGEFERLIGEEVLRPGDVTTWLQRVLRDRYGAISDGHDYLVAPLRRESAREFFTAVAKVWGSSWKRGGIKDGMPVLGRMEDNIANILGGILQGLIEEVEEQEGLWRQTVETADKRAEKVGARASATALKRLDGEKMGDGLVARINGFTILGEGPLAPLRARVVALRSLIDAAVLAANDDLSVRAAMLELD